MPFSNAMVTSVQAQLASFPADKLLTLLFAIDVVHGAVVNSSGVITIGGRALSNAQYGQLSDLIVDTF